MIVKALIAMSGGVDSTVAAVLAVDKGWLCEGFTLRLHDKGDDAVTGAARAAEKLGIAHHALDFTEIFRREVILPFIETYEKGGTPNPCVCCNRRVKFALPLIEAAVNQAAEQPSDFNYLVTGHYARVEKSGGRRLLMKAFDPKKDQSYVLFALDQAVLARCFFPLGELTKSQTREIAGKRSLLNADREDSQDICFVPDGDYGAFMESYTGRQYPEGGILDLDGNVIGRHKGIIRYTIGQRRGLGVAVNHPVYVHSKDIARNTVTLGPESSLYSKTLAAEQINLIACERIEKPMRVKVKTRYQQQEKAAWAVQTAEDEISVEFDEPHRAVTPGQAAVLYDGDIVIGGGIIKSMS